MTDYINPDKLYPDDISRRIDTPPGFDSLRDAGIKPMEYKSARIAEDDLPVGATVKESSKVLRDEDGEIVGFWMKPPESGSISCSNIEGLTCGDPDPISEWHPIPGHQDADGIHLDNGIEITEDGITIPFSGKVQAGYSPQTCTDGEEHPDYAIPVLTENMTINSDQVIITDDRCHIYVNGKELPECESYAWFEAAINEKAEREKPENQKHIDVLISFMNGLTKQINGGQFVEFKAVEVVRAIAFLCGEREESK